MENSAGYSRMSDNRLLKLIISCYGINPLEIIRESNNMFHISTEAESFLLYKYSHKQDSCLMGLSLKEYLRTNGFPYASDTIEATSGKLYVKHDHSLYYMEKDIKGCTMPLESLQECREVCHALGAFHSYSSGFKYKGASLRNNFKSLGTKLQDKWLLALSIKGILEKKRLLTDFDRHYLSIIDILIARLQICRQLSIGYEELCQNARQYPYICHNSIIESLLNTESGEPHLVRFDTASISVPIYELSELLKRLMRLDICNWDINALRELIASYNSYRSISKQEYEVLLCLLILPDKLLSVGKKRYIKKRGWSEKKYLQKLDKAVLIHQKQQQLIPLFEESYGVISDHENYR